MRVAVLVSNDLTHDQRVRKTCEVLMHLGCEITLIGRKHRDSEPIKRPYEVHRFSNMRFNRGALFYAELNFRLYRFLRRRRDVDAIWANDLDTLWPAYAVAKQRQIPLIYDSHEYFTEAAGLTGRPLPKYVWTQIERRIIPKLPVMITVNEHIAEAYRSKYGVAVRVVRNAPPLQPPVSPKNRTELGLPDGPLVILQGAFMDKDRGVLEAVEAMNYLPNARLLLVGAGEEWEAAKRIASGREPANQIIVWPKQPYERLRQLTASADVGLSLDKGIHMNYYFSLPNKLFDYIHAGIPVVASPLPEVRAVVNEYEVGVIIDDWSPERIADAVNQVLDKGKASYAERLQIAAERYNWQRETVAIKEVVQKVYFSKH